MTEQSKPVALNNHAGLTDWQVLRHQAETLVLSGFLPKAVDTWQKATAIIMYGKEIGMGPMEALQSIDVIQGKPTQKPQSMKAMVHKKIPNAIFRVVKSTDEECIYEAARPGDPVTQFFFTFKDAERMGMTGKDNYKKQPKVMLNWRCVGHVARTVFPDCLSGVSYTPEELGAEVDDEHNIIDVKAEKTEPTVTDDGKKEAEQKAKGIEKLRTSLKELKGMGWTDDEIFKELKIENYNDIVLKDSKTIYAAIEVLNDLPTKQAK